MNLSTRLAVAMASLVVLTAAAVGGISYRNIEATVLPRALERIDLDVALKTATCTAGIRDARGDVLGLRGGAPEAVVRAILGGGTNPIDGAPLSLWIDRLQKRLLAEISAKPEYLQVRLIGSADGGREIVRVMRAAAGAPARIVSAAELRQRGDRDYFRETLKLPAGEVYVSPIELNRKNGAIETPYIPVQRVATPIFAPDATPFGILIFNIDLRPAFERIRAMSGLGQTFIVNQRGDYLLHPDRAREFGFEFGKPHGLRDEFPEIAAALGTLSQAAVFRDRNEERVGAGGATMRLAGAQAVTILEVAPYRALLASVGAVRHATLLGGGLAALCAVLLAILLARSMARPMIAVTRAVESFARGEAAPVPTEAGGEIGRLARAFARMGAEVTEKTETIRHNAEILDSVMSGMSEAVLLVDAEGTIVFANSMARTLLGDQAAPGWKAWEAYQVLADDGLTPLERDRRPAARVIRGESIDDLELPVQVPGRGTRVFRFGGRPLRGADAGLSGGVLVFRDITELRETERQLLQSQKLEAVGQLTGGVAHDFNNLLMVIIGNAELIADAVRGRPELLGPINAIDSAAARGASLVRQLLAFARRQPLQPRETGINDLVIAAANLLRPTLGEQIEIESMLDDDAWPAMIDPTQLSTALINLGVNARDAMPDGGKLTFETSNVVLDESYAKANPEAKPGSYVMVAVSDTGTGIPEAIRDKVMQPFFTTKEVGKGTGLGLSMVYGFIKQSDGHIKIYSEVGHGTAVKLYLPRSSKDAANGPAVVPPVAIPRGSETILVVEDDEAVRASVIAQLQSLGYATISASDGPEALALVDGGARFDLLFTDIILPGGMNGRQLSERMAARVRPLKVLYTSGYTEDAIVHHGRLDPGVALLNKPYRKVDLARKLRAVLDANPAAT